MIESIQEFFSTLTDSEKIIHIGGLTLLLIIIFAETGLMVGFFLPGDYLLFTAGLLCGTTDLNVSLTALTLATTAAAIAGDFTGFFTGKYLGPRLFKRDDSLLFKKKYIEKTKIAFEKYGASALIVGRYLPVVRTFAPILAGATKMDFKKIYGLQYCWSSNLVWHFNSVGILVWEKSSICRSIHWLHRFNFCNYHWCIATARLL